MRKPGGYAFIVSPTEADVDIRSAAGAAIACRHERDADTFSCGHCGSIVHVPPRHRPGEYRRPLQAMHETHLPTLPRQGL
jgi:ribosomal protein L34E